ncbi:unnamed protein product [Amoebophrya sp. A25]|nr:unnamed protein product [Amoebophrya sp. A25]|eukprot:GSA25T00026130001.1
MNNISMSTRDSNSMVFLRFYLLVLLACCASLCTVANAAGMGGSATGQGDDASMGDDGGQELVGTQRGPAGRLKLKNTKLHPKPKQLSIDLRTLSGEVVVENLQVDPNATGKWFFSACQLAVARFSENQEKVANQGGTEEEAGGLSSTQFVIDASTQFVYGDRCFYPVSKSSAAKTISAILGLSTTTDDEQDSGGPNRRLALAGGVGGNDGGSGGSSVPAGSSPGRAVAPARKIVIQVIQSTLGIMTPDKSHTLVQTTHKGGRSNSIFASLLYEEDGARGQLRPGIEYYGEFDDFEVDFFTIRLDRMDIRPDPGDGHRNGVYVFREIEKNIRHQTDDLDRSRHPVHRTVDLLPQLWLPGVGAVSPSYAAWFSLLSHSKLGRMTKLLPGDFIQTYLPPSAYDAYVEMENDFNDIFTSHGDHSPWLVDRGTAVVAWRGAELRAKEWRHVANDYQFSAESDKVDIHIRGEIRDANPFFLAPACARLRYKFSLTLRFCLRWGLPLFQEDEAAAGTPSHISPSASPPSASSSTSPDVVASLQGIKLETNIAERGARDDEDSDYDEVWTTEKREVSGFWEM